MTTRPQRLRQYLADARGKLFEPGVHDCALFVAGWIYAETGVDHAARWRGRYTDLDAGRDLLAVAGHSDHVTYAASVLREIPPAMARTGDIAVIDRRAFGIVSDENVFVLRPDGVGTVSRMRVGKAFRV